LEQIIAMNETDPRRTDFIRKYSAIYGRFDCKRKPEKPLTLHEVCVNEAAAQICKLIPALLTRRDELFPLARQVVRDSGFGHSATIRLMSQSHSSRSDEGEQQAKRSRIASGSGSDAGKVSKSKNWDFCCFSAFNALTITAMLFSAIITQLLLLIKRLCFICCFFNTVEEKFKYRFLHASSIKLDAFLVEKFPVLKNYLIILFNFIEDWFEVDSA
jgi:hypothetical protein